MIPLINMMSKLLVFIAFLFSQNCFAGGFEHDLVTAAIDRTKNDVSYDGAYIPIAYPNGDVPKILVFAPMCLFVHTVSWV